MIALNSYICGDCMEYLPDFPDGYFDIAVVDPPYGLGEHGGKNRDHYVKKKTEIRFLSEADHMRIADGTKNRRTADISTNSKECPKIKLFLE